MSSLNHEFRTAKAKLAKKALYILSEETSLVTFKSNCLILQKPEMALRRFPLERIDRIIANQNVKWSGNAIMATLSQKIPITWVTREMKTVGHASPQQLFDCDLNDVCAAMVESYNWQDTYDNLLRSLRQQIVNGIFKEKDREDPFVEQAFRELQRSFVCLNQFEAHLPEQIRAACDSYVVQQLCSADLKLHYVGVGGEILNLAHDLSELLWATMNIDTCLTIQGENYVQIYAFEKWLNNNPFLMVEWLRHIRVKLSQCRYIWL